MEQPTSGYEILEREVLHLPLEDRSRLADRLLESLDEDDRIDLDPGWAEELRHRAKDINEGTARMIPHAEVQARLQESLAEIRNDPR